MTFPSALVATLLGAIVAWSGPPTPAAQEAQAAAPGFAWAAACRDCHREIHDAWEKTKHARALSRLTGAEQEQRCVGCHVTGPKTRVLDGRSVLNAGVQCESCHGPAAAHVRDPTKPGGVVRTPGDEACRACHNETSPHYRFFFYPGMAPLSHRVGR